MLQPRIIPVLLMKNNGLVKTVRFRSPSYIGDPLNAVKIFNDKGADELLLINIDASETNVPMDAARLREITAEAFMPVGYAGGIRTLEHVAQAIKSGVEKAVLCTATADLGFVTAAVKEFGSSTLSASVDYKNSLFGQRVYTQRGTRRSAFKPVDHCKALVDAGIGEIVLHNIDKDGTQNGYDMDLLKRVCAAVNVPVVICGGCADYDDLASAIKGGASGAAAGSVFVYSGKQKAILINYPDETWRRSAFAVNAES